MIDIQRSKEKVNGYRILRVVDTQKHMVVYSVRRRKFNTVEEAIEYAKSIEAGHDK